MVKLLQASLLFFSLTLLSLRADAQKFGFAEVLRNSPDRMTTFCVPANEQNLKLLDHDGVTIKYSAGNWLFITATPSWINDRKLSGKLTDFYFEYAPPALLSDSARAHHYVNEVHAGLGGLSGAYTGKDVIIGYVDTGIDFNHPDFIDSNGNTRVLRYWDQTMPDNASSPAEYGYGFIWTNTDIDNGICTSMDGNAHGTTVAGQGSGNARANGSNKGMAPDSKIVIVETDFTRPNWTLTVSDACDYVFRVADTLGLPAVVNLSIGTYFGSHDGNDPAAVAMEAQLDAKPGRIIVAAAGNSGAKGKHHQQGNPTSDTNFVWFVNNPFSSAVFGANTIFFDLWSDISDATWDFAMGVNNQGPGWSDRGRTNFHGATSSIGTTIYDTLWNNGNRLLTFEAYTEYIDGNYHMQFLARVDSAGLRYRFETTGSGKYDLWSGEWLGYNNQYWAGGPLAEFPDSIYYVGPDTLQSIVSSWNCSEKVVSVGNMRNRLGHIDANYNQYYPASDMTPPGKLSPASSKGPNRHNVVKPDVVGAGDVSLSAGPMWFLTNPAYNSSIDSGGWHVRNGGTSMASPAVAGIAALYLERCPHATYQDFLDDIHNTAYTNQYTGTVPNNAYGYGVAHALNAMLEQTFGPTPTITSDWATMVSSSSATGYQWYLDGNLLSGETNQDLIVSPPYGSYQVEAFNGDGCPSLSAPFVLSAGIEEMQDAKIIAYPNPASHTITISCDEEISLVELTDVNGRKIQLSPLSEGVYDVQSVASGAYVMTVHTSAGVYQSKIIRI